MRSSKPSFADILCDIVSLIESAQPGETLPRVLERLCRALKAEYCALTLLDAQSGQLAIEAAWGLSESQIKQGRYLIGEGVTGKVVRSGTAQLVSNIDDDPDFLGRITMERKALNDISFICAPLLVGNEAIGALSLVCKSASEAELKEKLKKTRVLASILAPTLRLHQLGADERVEAPASTLTYQPANLVGRSKAMQRLFSQIMQVAKSETTVLLSGESGVGKELVARAIHENSLRAGRPFVKLNCAALPETMLESELFGHERGAYTGAIRQRKGRFELANHGTIFLDEIGDISLATQITLLRVLQEKEFERIGGSETVRVDVRIITATHQDLPQLIAVGKFRDDLFYRLNVFPLFIQPLRERRADILLLADYFVEKYSREAGKKVTRLATSAIDALTAYHWPGNVRELENVIERAVLVTDSAVIHGRHLPPTLQTADGSDTPGGDLAQALSKLEKEMVLDALKATRGNMAEAGRRLGISERIMGLRVKKYGVDWRRFRTSS